MLYMIAIIVIALDQLIKWLVVTHMVLNQAIVMIPGVVDLFYIQNDGAAFSLFINQRILLIVVSLLVMAVIVFIERRHAVRKWDQLVALGLLLGGAAGNLVDRVHLGYVIDYVYLPFIRFPVFNLADSAIVVSMFYLLLRFFFTNEEKNKKNDGRDDSHE